MSAVLLDAPFEIIKEEHGFQKAKALDDPRDAGEADGSDGHTDGEEDQGRAIDIPFLRQIIRFRDFPGLEGEEKGRPAQIQKELDHEEWEKEKEKEQRRPQQCPIMVFQDIEEKFETIRGQIAFREIFFRDFPTEQGIAFHKRNPFAIAYAPS